MTTKKTFKRTTKQIEAAKILSSSKHALLYGGSRSAKTFTIIRSMIIRASKVRSRHAALRLAFNHAKTSIWLDTLPKVMSLCFPNLPYQENGSDYYITLPNGSEIWVGGLDEKKRVEKILGKEFSTLFFNECSQIPFSSVNVALTRLAEKNSLIKRAWYDENPPSKAHWSYWQFIKHVHPTEGYELDEKMYPSLLMNPIDNIENIDPEYINDILNNLPEKERNRFRDGIFNDAEEGLIYYAFNREKHVQKCSYNKSYPIWTGHDFNVNPMTAVIGQIINDTLYIFDEIYLKNSNTPAMCKYLRAKYSCHVSAVPDSTGKKRTTNANRSDIQIMRDYFEVVPTSNPYRIDRYAVVNAAFAANRIVISPKCKYTIRDLENVVYKEGTDQPDETDKMLTHISDALGYLVYKTINPLKSHVKKYAYTNSR